MHASNHKPIYMIFKGIGTKIKMFISYILSTWPMIPDLSKLSSFARVLNLWYFYRRIKDSSLLYVTTKVYRVQFLYHSDPAQSSQLQPRFHYIQMRPSRRQASATVDVRHVSGSEYFCSGISAASPNAAYILTNYCELRCYNPWTYII